MGVNASRISMGVNASCISMGFTMNAQHSQLGIMGGVNNTFISSTSAEIRMKAIVLLIPLVKMNLNMLPMTTIVEEMVMTTMVETVLKI